MKVCPNGHENEDWRTTCKTCYLALEEVELPPKPVPEPPPPPPAPAPAPVIEIDLPTLTVAVEPGGEASFEIRVGNVGSAPDTVTLQVDGELAAWVLPEPQSLALAPGTVGRAQLVFRLPASATVTPGEHRLELRATSAASGASSVAGATVVIPGAVPDEDPVPVPVPRPAWHRPAALATVLVLTIVVLFLAIVDDDEDTTLVTDTTDTMVPVLSNTALPSIEGTPRVLEVLNVDPGAWTAEELEFAYQWQRCDPAGDACGEIDGAVLPSYQAGNEDVGMRLRVNVTAAAGDRQATATSGPSAAVEPVPPVGIVMPNVVGFDRSEATAALSPNFQVVATTAGPQSESCDPEVESQAPAAGTMVTQGEQVVITTRPPRPFRECLKIILPPLLELPNLFPDQPGIQFFEEGA